MQTRRIRTNENGRCAREGADRKRGARSENLLRLSAAALASVAFSIAPPASLAHDEEEDTTAPIQEVIGDVGDVSFSTSCRGDDVQAIFDRGVALLHHMTYEVAEREFAKVAKVDPACAMAHWGIAISLIHPVWPGQPSAAVLTRGEGELAQARALQKTKREAAYVEALAAFYEDWEVVDHESRLRRWDAAQTAVREKYPGDDDAAAIAALIHIAASPKDDLQFRFNRESGALLEALRIRRPRHPGAVPTT